jgi:hypothetical protein
MWRREVRWMQSKVSEKCVASIVRIEGTAAVILCPEQVCSKSWNLRTRAHGVITQQRCMQMLPVPLHLQFHWPSPWQATNQPASPLQYWSAPLPLGLPSRRLLSIILRFTAIHSVILRSCINCRSSKAYNKLSCTNPGRQIVVEWHPILWVLSTGLTAVISKWVIDFRKMCVCVCVCPAGKDLRLRVKVMECCLASELYWWCNKASLHHLWNIGRTDKPNNDARVKRLRLNKLERK